MTTVIALLCATVANQAWMEIWKNSMNFSLLVTAKSIFHKVKNNIVLKHNGIHYLSPEWFSAFSLSWFTTTVSLERETGPGPQADLQGWAWKAKSGELQVRREKEGEQTPPTVVVSAVVTFTGSSPKRQTLRRINKCCCRENRNNYYVKWKVHQSVTARATMLLCYTHIEISIQFCLLDSVQCSIFPLTIY